VKALDEERQAAEARLTQVKWKGRDDGIAFAPGLDSQLVHLFRVVSSADARPTRSSRELFERLDAQAVEALGAVDELEAKGRDLEAEALGSGVSLFQVLDRATRGKTISGAGSRGGQEGEGEGHGR
jgi:hypothetical protein